MSKLQLGVGEGWVLCRHLDPTETAALEARGHQVVHGSLGSYTRKPGDGVFEPREAGPDPLFKARS